MWYHVECKGRVAFMTEAVTEVQFLTVQKVTGSRL